MTSLPLSPNCSHRAPCHGGVTRIHQTVARAAVGALLWLLIAGCRPAAEPLEVAIGVGALPGEPGYARVVQGVTLAIAALNDTPGAVRFRLALPADSSRSVVAVAAQHLIDPSVLAVVGHPESGHTLLALPVYADVASGGANALALISPTASSAGLSGISPWFFRTAPSDAATARTVARYARDSLGAHTAAVVYRNDAYGRDWTAAFTDAWRKGGGATLVRDPYVTGLTDWTLYARHIAARAPDVVLFPGDGEDAVQLLLAMRAAGLQVPFIGGDGTSVLSENTTFANTRYVSFYEPGEIDTPEAAAFLAAWEANARSRPDMFSALAYDATLAIGSAVQRATARTRAGVRQALEQVSLEGAAGRIAFDSATHNIAGREIALVTVRGTPEPEGDAP